MTGAVFLYDGDCAFCSSCARFIQRHIPTPADVRPWQRVDIAALGLDSGQCDTAVQWVGADGRHAAGPAAIAQLLRASRWYWRICGVLLGWAPLRWLAEPTYRWISAHRDRLPGGTATCALPAAQRPTAGPTAG